MAFNLLWNDDMSEVEDISRCINNILSIPSGSVPLARGLGINWTNLSKIPPELENDIATEIIEKIESYEPRVSVAEVRIEYDDSGTANVNIILRKGDRYGQYKRSG
ncbi:GPW/gp25 family protein [Lacrimispora sp. AGF001]|uniref:GPW/gp25 family protein n=1 Tax=Lacrimispora sp. AGF001 TaxID=3401631 RepID=UPI003B4379F9